MGKNQSDKKSSYKITKYQVKMLKIYRNYLIKLIEYYDCPSNIPRTLYKIEQDKLAHKSDSMDQNQIWIRLLDIEFDVIPQEIYEYDSTNPPDTWRKEDRIRVEDADEGKKRLMLQRKPKPKTELQIQYNTYQIRMQIEAINSLIKNPTDQHGPLLDLFQKHGDVTWPPLADRKKIKEWFFLTKNDYKGVDEQREFVTTAMKTPDFAFLDGPPGSGKTTILCELVLQMIKLGKRVLICGSTHVAVDNLIEKLAKDNMERKNLDMMILRIGDSKKISKGAKEFKSEENIKKTRDDMSSYLANKQPKTAASKILKVALHEDSAQSDYENSIVGSLVHDCSNIVCGTSIGILRHFDGKNNKDGKLRRFDMMILDEASKTTLQEFLVPALYADRWIIVGDVKQLAPYTDQENVDENIKHCIDRDSGQACLDIFLASKNRDRCTVIATNEDQTKQGYEKQCGYRKISFFDADRDEKKGLSQIIVGSSESLSKIKPPSKKIIVRHIKLLDELKEELDEEYEKTDNLDLKNQIENIKEWGKIDLENRTKWRKAYSKDFEESSWGSEIGWRLARNYESIPHAGRGSDDDDDGIKGEYADELEYLMPAPKITDDSNVDAKINNVESEINNVMTVAFPSILESIQYGFKIKKNTEFQDSTISSGMPREDFEKRHVLLTHQYRMHSNIAEFSHKYVYNSKALFTPDSIDSEREWTYKYNKKRMIWIDVRGKYEDRSNREEANRIVAELKEFCEYAKNNPKEDGSPWTISILSFYKNQEKTLRKYILDKVTKSSGWKDFKYPEINPKIEIEIHTVDSVQGHESDVVFISLANNYSNVFLNNPNRINVAVTRARYLCVIVGNKNAMSETRYQNDIVENKWTKKKARSLLKNLVISTGHKGEIT